MAPSPMNAIFMTAILLERRRPRRLDRRRLAAGKRKGAETAPCQPARRRRSTFGQETDRDPPASVAEREVASAIGPRKARPFARSTVVWVRGGRVAEGSRSVACFSMIKKKRAVRPLGQLLLSICEV